MPRIAFLKMDQPQSSCHYHTGPDSVALCKGCGAAAPQAPLTDRLTQLLEEDKVYLDPALTIEALSRKIGTNRTYLSQAIHKRFGMPFNRLLNVYRIKEYMRLASSETEKRFSIAGMAFQVGFVRKATFFTVFKNIVGCTPGEWHRSGASPSLPILL